MDWLNYHHLRYFWQVARLGSIARAAAELRVASPTISAQIKELEGALGEKLFKRSGRSLVLTEEGRTVLDYAEDIFAKGQELLHVLRRQPTGKALRLNVGIADAVPKLVVREILKPALALEHPVKAICREGGIDRLLADLATHRLDVVLSDRQTPETSRVKTFDHELGECGLAFFASPQLAEELRPTFPRSLDGAPAMLPTPPTAMRQSLDRWFDSIGARPEVVAEFDDAALLMVFAADELGFFAVPEVIGEEVGRRYGAVPIGRVESCRERFYAISVQRKLEHPAVAAITNAARQGLFA